MSQDTLAAVRRALEAALATLPPENAILEKATFQIFPGACRRCDTCGEPLTDHGNALTHSGACRRKRHADRQRAAYWARRGGRLIVGPGGQTEACTVTATALPPAPSDGTGTDSESSPDLPAGRAGPRTGRPQQAADYPVHTLPVTEATVLAALRSAGPLDELSIAHVLGISSPGGLDEVSRVIEALVYRRTLRQAGATGSGEDAREVYALVEGARLCPVSGQCPKSTHNQCPVLGHF